MDDARVPDRLTSALARADLRRPDRVWRFQVLLIKYPVFVGLLVAALGSPMSWRVLAASGGIYLCACAYETRHDRQLPLGAIS